MKRIGFSRWKLIHRFVYIAFPLAAYHAIVNYPEAFSEPFGLIMAVFIAGAIVFQVAGVLKRISKK
jgi:DMSO/TMAO reductase YedYZ heme-binding membrane subunit